MVYGPGLATSRRHPVSTTLGHSTHSTGVSHADRESHPVHRHHQCGRCSAWAQARGCAELASDTQLENTLGQTMHSRLGFTETERVVYFNMALGTEQDA